MEKVIEESLRCDGAALFSFFFSAKGVIRGLRKV